jgi:hypothetical protein
MDEPTARTLGGRLLREPLVHFLLGGAALFLVYGRVAEPSAERPDRIVVGEERVAMLAATFERTWLRPPDADELRALVDEHVIEEVLYREALALGLDRDDLIVRRRMRQKMELLNDGLAESEPDEAALRAFLAAHPDRFRAPARFGFEQVFVSSDADGAGARSAELLARLRAGAEPGALGDATLLPRRQDAATPAEVASSFGPEFAEALARAPADVWSGPVESAFGLHLVRVGAREPERLPELEEIRSAVEREWQAERRAEALRRFHDALRARYEVEVRMPGSPELATRP